MQTLVEEANEIRRRESAFYLQKLQREAEEVKRQRKELEIKSLIPLLFIFLPSLLLVTYVILAYFSHLRYGLLFFVPCLLFGLYLFLVDSYEWGEQNQKVKYLEKEIHALQVRNHSLQGQEGARKPQLSLAK